jgi:molybdate/tungstate transport system substrate-binding protein
MVFHPRLSANGDENDNGNTYTFGALEVDSSTDAKLKQRKRNRLKLFYFAILFIVAIILIISLSLVYTIGQNSNNESSLPNTITGNITVFYAASLQNLMSSVINPDFTISYDVAVVGISAASGALSTRLKGGAQADVFISADSAIDDDLLKYYVSGSSKPVLSWYTFWASTRIGLAYSTKSTFVSTFEAIAKGSIPWYLGLDKDLMKIGRTDPNLDPKGMQ